MSNQPGDDGPINYTLSGIIDYRSDPVGIYFGELTEHDVARGLMCEEIHKEQGEKRQHALGFVVQPLAPCNHPDERAGVKKAANVIG